MKQRIEQIIEAEKITKAAFAKKIGVSAPFITQLCKGDANPSDRTIGDICREFNVRREWLETGEGPMKLPSADEDLELVRDLLSDTPSRAAEIIMEMYPDLRKLNDAELDVFLKFVRMHKEKN